LEPTNIDINGNTKTLEQKKANMIVEQDNSEDKSMTENNKAEED
jgi:hypothetical protein